MYVELWMLYSGAVAALLVMILLLWLMVRNTARQQREDVAFAAQRSAMAEASEAVLAEDYDKALRGLAAMTQQDDDADLHVLMAKIFSRSGEANRAVELLENLLLRPRLQRDIRIRASLALARISLQQGAAGRAEKVLSDMQAQAPLNEEALGLLARVYVAGSEFKKARKLLARREKMAGNTAVDLSGELWLRQGMLLLGEDRLGEAKKLCSQAMKKAPRSPWVMLLCASLALLRADTDEAADMYRRAAASPLAQEDLALELRTMLWKCDSATRHVCARAVTEGIAKRDSASQRSGVWMTMQAELLALTRSDAATFYRFASDMTDARGWTRAAGNTPANP